MVGTSSTNCGSGNVETSEADQSCVSDKETGPSCRGADSPMKAEAQQTMQSASSSMDCGGHMKLEAHQAMQSGAASSTDCGGADEAATRMEMFGLVSFNWTLASMNSVMTLAIIPTKAGELAPVTKPAYIFLLCAAVAVPQLASPLIGVLSDNLRHPRGRRRPCIAVGTGLSICGLLEMWRSSYNAWPMAFAFGVFVMECGLALVNVAQISLVGDLCHQRQRGEASGAVVCSRFSGNLSGVLFVIWIYAKDPHAFYAIALGQLVLSCTVVWMSKRENSSVDNPPDVPLTNTMRRLYIIDPVGEANFFWLFMSCMFFYMAMAIQGFAFFYLQDILALHAGPTLQWFYIEVVVGSVGFAALLSCPLGGLSDFIGRQPFVYAAGVGLATVYVGCMLLLFVETFSMRLVLALVMAAACGVAMSCYTSVQFAMVLDYKPSGRGVAETMGLWSMAEFGGSLLGGLAGAALLHWRGTMSGGNADVLMGLPSFFQMDATSQSYYAEGYLAVLSMGVNSALVSVLLALPVFGMK